MCFLSLGSIKRRASLLASDADGFGTTGFAGDLRKATNSILAKLEHCISSMTWAQKAETFAVSSRRPIRNGGRTTRKGRRWTPAFKRSETENCERQDKLAADFLLPPTRRRHG